MSGAEIAAEVAAALAEAGEATGDGALTGTLYRRGTAHFSEHSPTYADPEPYTVTLLVDKFTLMEQASNRVEVGDKKFIVAAHGLTIEPTTDDWLVVKGVGYSIENVDSLAPGGVPIQYEIQARRRITED